MRRPAFDPWGGRQPKYERLVRLAPGKFGFIAKLPSGEPTTVPLGALTLRPPAATTRFGDPRCYCADNCWCRQPILWRLRYLLPFPHRGRA